MKKMKNTQNQKLKWLGLMLQNITFVEELFLNTKELMTDFKKIFVHYIVKLDYLNVLMERDYSGDEILKFFQL